jgi:hypothetical protein
VTVRWSIPAAVRAREVGGETVLLHLETRLYFTLDEIGTVAWQRLTEGAGLDRIVEQVVAAYDVDAATARRDLEELVGELVEAGLLVSISE